MGSGIVWYLLSYNIYLKMSESWVKFVIFVIMKKVLVIILITFSTFLIHSDVNAQCAMCSANAEMSIKEGNGQGKGLNTGILYLLAIPYVLLVGVGVFWYRNYRKKDVPNPFGN